MMKNEEFALECRRRYAEDGLVVDASNGEFAHCPLPKGMGDAGYYLLHDDHQWQGLLQSEDVGRKCFYEYHTRRFLLEGSFVEGWFDLWDLYDKWSGAPKETATFKNPETGETAQLTCREAAERGWVGFAKGKTSYINPKTGECRLLQPKEAEEMGWRHRNAGRSPRRSPETGRIRLMTDSEAEESGCIPMNAGKGLYRDPETGRCRWVPVGEANALGYAGATKGSRQEQVQCPHCGTVGGANIMRRWHFDNCPGRSV